MTLTPYAGGRRLVSACALVAIVALAITLVGGFLVQDARPVLFGYLVAYVYWLGIALGALIMLGSFHASSAKWPVVLRRFVESVPLSIPLFVVLFIPIALAMKRIFPWADLAGQAPAMQQAIEHKRVYLNVPFFLLRAAFYFVVWIVVAHQLRAWSVRQDGSGALTLTVWQRRLGAGSLPFLALTMTFAAFDWQMSLDPRFFSTIFGVYWFAGSFMAAFAVVIIAATLSRDDPTLFGHHMNAEHFHSLGKFLLAFVAFWAYIAFSQFMLIWIANIPEEVPWYLIRTQSGWGRVGAFLAVFQFIVPFFLLLSRDLKRNPRTLSWIAAWILLVHWFDVYWVVMPRLHLDGPHPTLFDLTAFVGVGAAAVGFTVWRMRGAANVPVRDPYLEDSLRYLPQ